MINTLYYKITSYKPLLYPVFYALLFAFLFLFILNVDHNSFDPSVKNFQIFNNFLLFMKLSMSFFISILAILKIVDINSFSTSFIQYDFIAKKNKTYCFVYPFLEISIAVCMLFSNLPFFIKTIVGILAIFIGIAGASSITVYLKKPQSNKKKISCACTGGNSQVKLGLLSIVENVMLIIIGISIWLL